MWQEIVKCYVVARLSEFHLTWYPQVCVCVWGGPDMLLNASDYGDYCICGLCPLFIILNRTRANRTCFCHSVERRGGTQRLSWNGGNILWNLGSCLPNYLMSNVIRPQALISATLRTPHFLCSLLWLQSNLYITVHSHFQLLLLLDECEVTPGFYTVDVCGSVQQGGTLNFTHV